MHKVIVTWDDEISRCYGTLQAMGRSYEHNTKVTFAY